ATQVSPCFHTRRSSDLDAVKPLRFGRVRRRAHLAEAKGRRTGGAFDDAEARQREPRVDAEYSQTGTSPQPVPCWPFAVRSGIPAARRRRGPLLRGRQSLQNLKQLV